MSISKKFIPCRTCAKKPGPFPGYFFVEKEGKTFVQECKCHKAWMEEFELQRKFAEAGVWAITHYNPLEDYKGQLSRDGMLDIVALAKGWDEVSPHMYYIYGPNGTQKTTLMMWLSQQLIQSGKKVVYTLMETLLVSLTPDFADTTGKRAAFVDKALEADLLIIDESFDRSKVTLYKSGYQLPFLDRFIRQRFDIGRKAIIFVSNKPKSLIASEGFGASIESLVCRNTSKTTLLLEDKYIKTVTAENTRRLFV